MADPIRRYRQILEGGRTPSFLRLRECRVDFADDLPTDYLWNLHREGMRRHRLGNGGDGRSDLLSLKALLASRVLGACHLCERRCGTDRTSGIAGHCGVLEALVSSEFIHMGEEPPLVPSYTVFFPGCTFECVFCQNYDISTHPGTGIRVEPEAMAGRIERVAGPVPGQGGKARNVNWVGGDPTPNLPFVLQVLVHLDVGVPQIWNSNMYLSMESMDLLDGAIDIYLTDLKYGNDACALRLSNAPRYWKVVTRNHLLAMERGEVIVRHLVLPSHLECCTFPVLEWLAENLPGALVNVMAQYRPVHRAGEHPDIDHHLNRDEYRRALERAQDLGLLLV